MRQVGGFLRVSSTNKTDCHDIIESGIKHHKPKLTLTYSFSNFNLLLWNHWYILKQTWIALGGSFLTCIHMYSPKWLNMKISLICWNFLLHFCAEIWVLARHAQDNVLLKYIPVLSLKLNNYANYAYRYILCILTKNHLKIFFST